jgi:hypothetical protein
VTSVQFRGESTTPGLPWTVQDISIWSREAPAAQVAMNVPH